MFFGKRKFKFMKKKYYSLLYLVSCIIILCLPGESCFSQIQKFQKYFSSSDYGFGIDILQEDSGYVLLCNKYSFGASINNWAVINTNVSGNYLFHKEFSYSSNKTNAVRFYKSSAGGYYILGNINYNTSTSDFTIAKLDRSA